MDYEGKLYSSTRLAYYCIGQPENWKAPDTMLSFASLQQQIADFLTS